MNIAEIGISTPFHAPRIVVYGAPGIGKTTLAAAMPMPLIIPLEDTGPVTARYTPRPRTLPDFMGMLDDVLAQPHEYKTLVIDSISALEEMVFSHIADKFNKDQVGEIPYGRGYVFAADKMLSIFDKLQAIRTKRYMVIFLIAHNRIDRVNDPVNESYDQHVPDVHKQTLPKLIAWADAVLFAGYQVIVKKEGEGLKERGRGIGTGKRYLQTEYSPAVIAKNRYDMPKVIPMDAKAILKTVAAKQRVIDSTATTTINDFEEIEVDATETTNTEN
jgi:hypothetical protein